MSDLTRSHPICQWMSNRYLLATFSIALAVRLINLLLLSGPDAFFSQNDSTMYWSLGAALAHSPSFVAPLLSSTERMPLYPLLLGGVQSLFGDVPAVVTTLQAVVDSGTCLLIAALGGLYSRQVGLIAGLLAALSANLIIHSTQILTESTFVFFFSAFLYAGARFLRMPDVRLALIAGTAGGLSLMVRPVSAILLVAAVPVVFFGAILLGRRMVVAFTTTALFLAGVIVPVAPVVLRNVTVYDSWKLMSETGEHLAFWIVPLVTQRATGAAFEVTAAHMRARFGDELTERGLTRELNPFVLDAVKVDLARKTMAELPRIAFAEAWVEGMIVDIAAPAILVDPRVRALPKPDYYSTPGQSLWSRSQTYLFDSPGLYQGIFVVSVLAALPFLLLQVAGFVMLVRERPWAAVFAGGTLAYFLMVNGPVATPKYRLPMEPVLIVLTAIALERALNRGRAMKGSSSP